MSPGAAAVVATHGSGRSLLGIEDVLVTGVGHAHVAAMRGSLRANGGDLVMVHVANPREAEIWADVATGLLAPDRGRVSIVGTDAASLDVETGDWLRGRIGRVFSRGNWLDRLSLMDNILIQARHHTWRNEDDIRREASDLAESFGLPGIPLGLPNSYTRSELQRAACVRAFLGSPVLVLLEDPTYGARGEMLPPLVEAIRAARNRGAAVVWFSLSMDVLRDRSIPASRRYRMAGRELMEVGTT